jgi:DNA mismatch repair ATPase MutL
MKLFDQHALAERINYEKLVKKDSLQATSTTQ